jgi:hypothetical protein
MITSGAIHASLSHAPAGATLTPTPPRHHLLRYYETIAGGAGAGPTWEGRSGVHTHMTNTRITDPGGWVGGNRGGVEDLNWASVYQVAHKLLQLSIHKLSMARAVMFMCTAVGS